MQRARPGIIMTGHPGDSEIAALGVAQYEQCSPIALTAELDVAIAQGTQRDRNRERWQRQPKRILQQRRVGWDHFHHDDRMPCIDTVAHASDDLTWPRLEHAIRFPTTAKTEQTTTLNS